MYLNNIRPISHDESERYWPGNLGRWKYIVDGYGIINLSKSFNLVK